MACKPSWTLIFPLFYLLARTIVYHYKHLLVLRCGSKLGVETRVAVLHVERGFLVSALQSSYPRNVCGLISKTEALE